MMSLSAPLMVWIVDPMERAVRTFVQQYVVVLMAAGTSGMLVHQNWLFAADSAGFAALASLVTTLMMIKVPPLGDVQDLTVRVVKTFVQSMVGTLVASNALSVVHADWKGAVAVAVPVALTALLTSLAALGVPGTHGVSLVPSGRVVAVDAGAPGDEVDVAAEDAKAVIEDGESLFEVGKHRAE